MIYCDSTIDKYDGKLMVTFNEFVKHYNKEAVLLQRNTEPQLFADANKTVNEFNRKYSMFCNYNLTKWNSETINERFNSIMLGYKKVLLKQS